MITIRRSWRRLWLMYEWEYYDSAYGLGFGFRWTRVGAKRAIRDCVADLVLDW